MPTLSHTRRKAQLATIHVARQQLDMDELTYRGMLARVSATCGLERSSAADLTERQRTAVIEEMRRLGAARPIGKRQARSFPGRPANTDAADLSALIGKVEALLASMRLPWSYANAIAQQQCGVERVAWVRRGDQLRGIIAALAVEQEKRQLDAAVTGELQRLGWEPERVVEVLRPLRPGWRRHRPSLRLVLEYLRHQATTGP